MVSVVSAIYGSYDEVHPPLEQSVKCEFTMITDNPGLDTPGWRKAVDYKNRLHPRMGAKKPKLQPWRYSVADGPWIWIDGSFEVTSPTFVEEALAASEGHPISQWVHPWRDCIFDEALHSWNLPKYTDQPIRQQAAHYNNKHPAHWGLWATGLIVYREKLDYLADLWWAELQQWGYQDQVSQPVALRAAGLRPFQLPGGLHQSPWLRWHNHRSEL